MERVDRITGFVMHLDSVAEIDPPTHGIVADDIARRAQGFGRYGFKVDYGALLVDEKIYAVA